MSDIEAHRREMRDAVRRQHEDDLAQQRAELEERDRCESIEARESYWTGVMAQMPDHVKRTRYGSDVTS